MTNTVETEVSNEYKKQPDTAMVCY